MAKKASTLVSDKSRVACQIKPYLGKVKVRREGVERFLWEGDQSHAFAG
jgi:hypothetical protein